MKNAFLIAGIMVLSICATVVVMFEREREHQQTLAYVKAGYVQQLGKEPVQYKIIKRWVRPGMSVPQRRTVPKQTVAPKKAKKRKR